MARQLVIRDKDRGWKNLAKTIAKRKPRYVEVGVMSENDNRSDGLTNTFLALIHEYGIGVPERSFIRSTIEKNTVEYMKFIKQLTNMIIYGKMNKGIALMLLGAKVEGDIKAAIDEGIDPANAPYTIAMKGSSKPLIDTGQLKSSIDHRIVK